MKYQEEKKMESHVALQLFSASGSTLYLVCWCSPDYGFRYIFQTVLCILS